MYTKKQGNVNHKQEKIKKQKQKTTEMMIDGTRLDIKPPVINMRREMEDTEKINQMALTEVASKDNSK